MQYACVLRTNTCMYICLCMYTYVISLNHTTSYRKKNDCILMSISSLN